MAKKTIKLNVDVNGMSLNDVLNFDVNTLVKLNRNDLAKLTSRLTSVANKRIKSLRSSKSVKGTSFALKTLQREGKNKFSVKGKSHNQLLKEYARASKFINAKTSTVKGTIKVYRKTMEILETRYGKKVVQRTNIERLFDMLHKAQENGTVGKRGSKGSLMARDALFEMFSSSFVDEMSEEQIMTDLENRVNKLYEDYEEFDKDNENVENNEDNKDNEEDEE